MRQTPFKWNQESFCLEPFFRKGRAPHPYFSTNLGALFAADCMAILPHIEDGVIDTVFADPPFNLGKEYGKNTDDLKPDAEYMAWCRKWIA